MDYGIWNSEKYSFFSGHGQEHVILSAIYKWAKIINYLLSCNMKFYYAILKYCKDKEHDDPFETPLIYIDEAKASFGIK